MKNQRFALIVILMATLGIFCTESSSTNIFTLTVNITPEEGGSVIPSQELRLPENEELELLAVNNEGYTFTGWSGFVTSTENPLSVTMTGDIELTANFEIKSYNLITAVDGNGTITETVISAKTEYDYGTIVQLQAIPDEGWRFVEWTGDVESNEETVQITVTDDASVIAVFELDQVQPVDVEKTNTTKIYAHYMPWYTSKPHDGYWSSHWTMNNRNPDNIVDGQRDIASHFYPLIGPYSSQDPDLVEYHLLLMKFSGIDGVLIDWYGTYDVFDYEANLLGSNALIDKIDEVGLEFGIVYEDRTTESVVNAGGASSTTAAATADFQYINDNYFSHPNYIKVNNAPLALVFTPIVIESGSAWNQIFTGIDPNPEFLALWYQGGDLGTENDGEYAWVYGANGNHENELINFYNSRLPQQDMGIGSAYPGFMDFYEEGGQGDIIGWEIPYSGAEVFEQTLNLATQYNLDYLQLVTWNDFGEGTIIEPTVEHQYTMLETVQGFAGVTLTKTELELAFQLYNLRKEYSINAEVQLQLDQAFNYLVTLQWSEAKDILDSL
jgi:uncharacterized repeat protein (TIGR02543 family)